MSLSPMSPPSMSRLVTRVARLAAAALAAVAVTAALSAAPAAAKSASTTIAAKKPKICGQGGYARGYARARIPLRASVAKIRQRARMNWMKRVIAKCGYLYGRWSWAKKKSQKCFKRRTKLGVRYVLCVAKAQPSRAGLPRPKRFSKLRLKKN